MDKWSYEKKQKVVHCIYSLGTRNENETSEFSVSSFYDANLTGYLINNRNHQVIQGSRGTGKTHILRVLEQKMEDAHTHCVFLDCRNIGSSGSCGFDDDPNPARFFQHFLEELQEKLSRYYEMYYFDNEEIKKDVFDLLVELKAAVIISNDEINKVTRTVSRNIDNKSNNKVGTQVGWPPSFGYKRQKNTQIGKAQSEEITQDISLRKSISFSRFGRILGDLLFLTDKKLIILLDEWSSIPLDIQPLFAEFLRRTLFPINEVKFKIAVVPHRKLFRTEQNGNSIGLELGADIFVALDLDQRYSVDSSPKEIFAFCFGFFCQHLSSHLDEIIEPVEYLKNMFLDPSDAYVLVRAAEGNPRDFIHLTFLCLQSWQSEFSDDPTIDREAIIKSSKSYFETSKYSNCDEDSKDLLWKLIQFVVYTNENRGFLINKKYIKLHPWKTLIDQRILHVLDNNYFDYSSTLSPCAILIINFGAYSDILLNKKTVNFFCAGDFLEPKVFAKVPDEFPKKKLSYSGDRRFYCCFIDERNNLLFTRYFSNVRKKK